MCQFFVVVVVVVCLFVCFFISYSLYHRVASAWKWYEASTRKNGARNRNAPLISRVSLARSVISYSDITFRCVLRWPA